MQTGTQRTIPTVGYLWVPNGEDGTKLDKLVITNDRGFSLVEPAPPVSSQ